MRVEQYRLEAVELESNCKAVISQPNLVLVFASSQLMAAEGTFSVLKSVYPDSAIAGCSTAGEIFQETVSDDGIVICEISFDSSQCSVVSTPVLDIKNSYSAGADLGGEISTEGLKAVIVLGPGVNVNGSAIVDGLVSILGEGVPVSGGLAGDGSDFIQTSTLTTEGVSHNSVCAIALYGEQLKTEYGSFGGWAPFGPLRKVTKNDANILYELDGKPALDLYKQYLGEYASELPSSALLFPLEMVSESKQESGLIRTILGIDEEKGSLTLAGDIDPNGYLRLMHTSIDGLINGAEIAADSVSISDQNRLAILVSCVGRKLVMGDEVSEEVEAVKMKLGENTTTTGFYSYGEICPSAGLTQCDLHNQTMTLTVISEG